MLSPVLNLFSLTYLTFRRFIAGSFHLLHMLLEDYILYTVENQNTADEQLAQSSVRLTKEKSFMEGWYFT